MKLNTDDDSGGFVAASVLLHILDEMNKRGITPEMLSQMLGVDLKIHAADPDGWVPVRLLEEALHKVLAVFSDPLLGMRASRLENGAVFGVLGYLAQACATLQEIFEATARYERLVSDIGTTSLRHEPGVVLCCWDCRTSDDLFRRHATEFLLCSWTRAFLLLNDQPERKLLAVHFRHGAPADPTVLAKYEKVFGCPVKFDQPESALVVPISVMQARLRNPSPSLRETLERHARLLLTRNKAETSLVDRIRRRLRVLLQQGNVSREHLAGELGISARHLHRQLQKAGSSYQELIDDLRLELAKDWLQDPTLSVEAIAQRLSFEPPSFIRWFRLKVGQTPGDYREGIQATTAH